MPYDENGYYYEYEEDSEYYYEAACYQDSFVQKNIYHGEIEIAEVIKQQPSEDCILYCLATSYMLIADIDCGEDIDVPLSILNRYVAENGGSWRVYKTKNGMRYLQTDIAYHGVNKSAIATLEQLQSDPKYNKLCSTGGRFMARLTPRISLEEVEKYYEEIDIGNTPKIAVTRFLKTVGEVNICGMVQHMVCLHDLVTQSKLSLPLM